ncbi:MAG: hypothetical protein Q8K18_12445 [Burkholderiales bacterium]|nr:hypothetical protein [Burkholderiales bacterium]
MTLERLGKSWLWMMALLLSIMASPAFPQLAQKPTVTVYSSPT